MPKILDFHKTNQPFQIRNKTATKAEIVLYGAIGASWFEDSITAKQFSDELKGLASTVTQIDLRINSPGGDVFDGIAIYNRIKQHPAKVTVYVDGLAASIASIIALAGDEIVIGDGALMMIHLPWTFCAGNRNELDNTINRLMDVEEQMVSIYAKKCGLPRAEIKAMLEKETWMDATQAIEMGFADTKSEDTMAIAASVLSKATWINKMPKMKTQDDVARVEIENLKNKISSFIARK
jgi:ATP-dependent protease ClpP protease subunit